MCTLILHESFLHCIVLSSINSPQHAKYKLLSREQRAHTPHRHLVSNPFEWICAYNGCIRLVHGPSYKPTQVYPKTHYRFNSSQSDFSSVGTPMQLWILKLVKVKDCIGSGRPKATIYHTPLGKYSATY